MLVADGGLHITGRLLVGVGKKPVQLCSYTVAHKPSKELMWDIDTAQQQQSQVGSCCLPNLSA